MPDQLTTPVWIDGDPLMEAIAAAVWERCRTEGTSLVVDDPRNIAAVAAAQVRTVHGSAEYGQAVHDGLYEASVDGQLIFLDHAEDAIRSVRDREVAQLSAEVQAARQYAAEMRDFASPRGVAVHYADSLTAAMDRAKEQTR